MSVSMAKPYASPVKGCEQSPLWISDRYLSGRACDVISPAGTRGEYHPGREGDTCCANHRKSLHEISTSRSCPSIGFAQFLPEEEDGSGASGGCAVICRQGSGKLTHTKDSCIAFKSTNYDELAANFQPENSSLLLLCALSHVSEWSVR